MELGVWRDIDAMWLVGVGGATTATGYFVDRHGNQAKDSSGALAPSFAAGVINAPGGTPKTWAQIAGLSDTVRKTYPNAAGLVVTLAGAVWLQCQSTGSVSSDFQTNPTNYEQVPTFTPYANNFGANE